MTRSISVLEVSDPALWERLEAELPLEGLLGEQLSPTRRVALPAFEKQALPQLQGRVLVRYARRDPASLQQHQGELLAAIGRLPPRTRAVLHSAQRHALDGVVVGIHAWDPILDAHHVRALHGAALIRAEGLGEGEHTVGRYHLDPDLPPPPEVAYDFAEAAMDETEDLSPPGPGLAGILHDAASLAAALDAVAPRRTHKGSLGKVDARNLGRRLADPSLAEDGAFEAHPRWGLALRALEALGAVSMDPFTRTLQLDLGLDQTLSGETTDAIERFVHKLLDRDLHPLVPALRAALRAAGGGAVDQVIFLDLLREQHRDVLFPAWEREGQPVYPMLEDERGRRYDDDGWELVETRLVDRALRLLARVGLVRRADGVFAATEDGRHWAESHDGPHPPIWVSSDLEIIVPPGALTAWERFQIERLSTCRSRDVTDRYRLDRDGLRRWLAGHDLDEALDLLRRRAPGLPPNVVETLQSWDRAARQIVLTRGQLVED